MVPERPVAHVSRPQRGPVRACRIGCGERLVEWLIEHHRDDEHAQDVRRPPTIIATLPDWPHRNRAITASDALVSVVRRKTGMNSDVPMSALNAFMMVAPAGPNR